MTPPRKICPRRKRAKHASAGFTLLELMFAAGILALALSLLFGSLISINIVGQLSESRTQANTQLAGVLEELRSLPIQSVISYTPPPLQYPGVDQAITLRYVNAAGTEVALPLAEGANVPNNLPNPLRLKATFIWEDNQGRAYSVTAVTEHGR